MKALILDGSQEHDIIAGQILTTLVSNLQNKGYTTETITIREKKIIDCAGDFFCWVRTPGMCVHDDDNRKITSLIINSELIIYLTPIKFGGFSSILKRTIDHQIQNLSPFFRSKNHEIHHKKRYDRYSSILAIGWLEQPDKQQETIFRHLVERSAINGHAPTWSSRVVYNSSTKVQISQAIMSSLDEIEGKVKVPPVKIDFAQELFKSSTKVAPISQVLILVGSPRRQKSTSFAIAKLLMDELSAKGIHVFALHLHDILKDTEQIFILHNSIDNADAVILATPLYADTLHASTLEALSTIYSYRKENPSSSKPLFIPIINCGFPESHQTNNAALLCKVFAEQTDFIWGNAIQIGGGEAIRSKLQAGKTGGLVVPIKKAMHIAAIALAEGKAIPKEAISLAGRKMVPSWFYTFFGAINWRREARKWKVYKLLNRKPYQN
jgi:Multimeric flavodoxin WrbA